MSDKDLFVCFGTSKGFKAWLIKRVTRSELTHSWVDYPSDTLGERWVLHATARGVITEYYKSVLKTYPKYRMYRCKEPEKLLEGLRSAEIRKHVGRTNYDFIVIWNGFWLLIKNWTGWGFLRRFALINEKKMSCSELIARLVEISDLVVLDDHSELTTTGALEELVKVSGNFEDPLAVHPHLT